MNTLLTGGLTDARGRAWHGLTIEFRTETNDNWQIGTVYKQRGAPTIIKLVDPADGYIRDIMGWLVTEFVIRAAGS